MHGQVRTNYSVREHLQFARVQFVSLPDTKYKVRSGNVGCQTLALMPAAACRNITRIAHRCKFILRLSRAGLFFNTLKVYEPLSAILLDFITV